MDRKELGRRGYIWSKRIIILYEIIIKLKKAKGF